MVAGGDQDATDRILLAGVGRRARQQIAAAYAIGVVEMISFATQAGEETSLHGTMYLGATVLYFISAFAINRLAAVVEKRTRLAGALGGK